MNYMKKYIISTICIMMAVFMLSSCGKNEPEKQKEYLNADNKYEYSWFKNMPEDLRYIYIKQYLSGTKNILYNNISNSSFDSMFIMDMLLYTNDSAILDPIKRLFQ